MDESIKCECGHNQFWYMANNIVRCIQCHREYRYIGGDYFTRAFDPYLGAYTEWELTSV